MTESREDQVLRMVRRAGILRPRDLAKHGIPRQYLRILEQRGLVHRIGRGLYVAHDAPVTEHHSLAEVCKRVPHGVVCLLSALRFHGLTTQTPRAVWLAIGEKARLPKTGPTHLRIVRFPRKTLLCGVQEHSIEGVSVKVYNVAKTAADCFKYRNKIGLDVALEALRECWRGRRATMDELWHYAKICRMANVMRPYLESLT
ncbi:MAG: type IV toxin-antitoxin system AbiEi family antitoxin domain-containing protein [Phycisphaerae bacterium]